MAKILKVSESGYYKWRNKLNAPLTEKELEDIEITNEIQAVFRKSRGSFGARKVTKVINKNRQKAVNHKRIYRLMREHHLYSRASKKYITTTDSKHSEAIADNLLARDFTVNRPNEVMVSDTTVVKTKQGDVYVAGILDLCGRMPVGMAMSMHNDRFLVMEALKDMIVRGCGADGCILHSDRGSTYASKDYRIMLSQNNLLCSMSRKGDCWDNAPMESFWGKMKSEWLKNKYDTIEDAKKDIYEYVWQFYPYERPHESNGYFTPYEIYTQATL
jgi:putative transposase